LKELSKETKEPVNNSLDKKGANWLIIDALFCGVFGRHSFTALYFDHADLNADFAVSSFSISMGETAKRQKAGKEIQMKKKDKNKEMKRDRLRKMLF
jgi:hypothetical protein